MPVPAHPARTSTAAIVVVQVAVRHIRIRDSPSALDRRRIVRSAVGVSREIGRERNRGIGGVGKLRKALLPEAIVQSPLERAHLALRYAIRGPGGIRLLRALPRGEIRQVLQANALAFLAMTGGAREVMRAAAVEEHLLA